jgi:hypothetical protein
MRLLFSMTMLSSSTKWKLSTDGSADSTTSVSHAGPVLPFCDAVLPFYDAMRSFDHIGHSRRASATILRSEAFYTASYQTDTISMSDLDVSLHVELVNLTGIYDGQAIFEVGNNNSLWKARAKKNARVPSAIDRNACLRQLE